VHAGLGRPFQEALDDEARTIGASFETPYAQAAVAAFAARSSKPGRE
jgi:2-(1,2-epoxy-1,2-dihydrophenyl)acetyl-CoA isomerase